MKTLSASVDEKTATDIAAHAHHQQRSIRQLVGFAIVEWLDRNKSKLPKNGKKP